MSLPISGLYSDQPAIRPYRPDDHHGLMRFLENVLDGMGHAFLPEGKDADIRDIDTVYLCNQGAFRVADFQDQIRGCIGVRRYSEEIAELKRLYLAPEFRGVGLGHALCLAAIHDAEMLGYRFLRLDTTHRSEAAFGMFQKLGFREIERYNADPFAEIFMEKAL